MGRLFSGGTRELLAKLLRIEQEIAGLHVKADQALAAVRNRAVDAEAAFARLHNRISDSETATARVLQGVADQILHLPAPDENPRPEPIQVPPKTPGDPAGVAASGPAVPPSAAKATPGRKG